MARTYVQMQNDVYAALRDSERSFTDIDDVKVWLNEGYVDLCARLQMPEVTVTGTTSETGTITLPSNFVTMKRLIIDETEMNWAPGDIFINHELADTSTSLYRIWDDTIETFPVADELAYTMEYIKRPTEMSADGDFASELPQELQPRIVFYARATAKLIEGEMQEYQIWWDKYERGLPGPPRATYRRIPGPIAMIPESNPLW